MYSILEFKELKSQNTRVLPVNQAQKVVDRPTSCGVDRKFPDLSILTSLCKTRENKIDVKNGRFPLIF